MKRILVVDHEFEVAAGLKALLKRKYQVEVALGIGMALLKLQREPFDLVLLDFEMPGQDGARMVERLSELGLHTPVLLMAENPVLLRYRSIGLRVAGRLSKQIDFDELESRIDRTLRRTKKRPPTFAGRRPPGTVCADS